MADLGPAAAGAAGAAVVAASPLLPPPAGSPQVFGPAPLAGAIGGGAEGIGGCGVSVGGKLAGLAAAIGGGAALPVATAAASGSEDDARALGIARDHDEKRSKVLREGALACMTSDLDGSARKGRLTLTGTTATEIRVPGARSVGRAS